MALHSMLAASCSANRSWFGVCIIFQAEYILPVVMLTRVSNAMQSPVNLKVAALAWGVNWEQKRKETTNRNWVPAQLDEIQLRQPSIGVLHLDARPYCSYDEENAWRGQKGPENPNICRA